MTTTDKASAPLSANEPTVTNRESRSIRNWMTPSPHTVGKDQPLGMARSIMRNFNVRHLPVLDKGKLVGVLSERDVYFLESAPSFDPDVDRVEEGMSQDVYFASAVTPLHEVVGEMAKHKYGCAIVVDGPRVVGIFTASDGLEMLAERLREESA